MVHFGVTVLLDQSLLCLSFDFLVYGFERFLQYFWIMFCPNGAIYFMKWGNHSQSKKINKATQHNAATTKLHNWWMFPKFASFLLVPSNAMMAFTGKHFNFSFIDQRTCLQNLWWSLSPSLLTRCNLVFYAAIVIIPSFSLSGLLAQYMDLF